MREEPAPDPDSLSLAMQHLNSFGPHKIVVMDEKSWIHGESEGGPTWRQFRPSSLWIAYRDGSTCPIDAPAPV